MNTFNPFAQYEDFELPAKPERDEPEDRRNSAFISRRATAEMISRRGAGPGRRGG